MSDNPKVLHEMDHEAIRWQYCAICGEQKQRVVHEPDRPDFAICDNCDSAFVLEDGGNMRMMYGKIGLDLPETRKFALKQWRPYFEIRAKARAEKDKDDSPEILPAELKSTSDMPGVHGKYATNVDALMDLEAERSELLYDSAKKPQDPPRRLAETGELPNIDDLFENFD